MMLSGLLKSDIAVKVNIQIIDAFVKMRQYFANVISNNDILINHENRILRLEKTFDKFNKKKEINKHAWNIAKQGKASETTDKEYEEIIDNFFDDQEAIVKLEREYIYKYREVLSDKKIYMIYWAEFKFNRNMMKILQEMDDKDIK